MKYYEFKIFLDDSETSLAFHAYIANKKSYRIKYDLNNTYTELFKKIKDGNFSVKYFVTNNFFSGEDVSYKTIDIKSADDADKAIENLEKFKELYSNIYSFRVNFERSHLQPQLGFVFDGPDYSLADGMAPDALLNASEFQNKMYKTLQAANNIDFGDVFIEQPKAGSIDLNVHTTKTPNLTMLKQFLESIQNKNINRDFLRSDNDNSKVFKKVIKQLLELKKFDNLKNFTFKIGHDDIKFSGSVLDYLFEEGNNLYGDPVTFNEAVIEYGHKLKNQNIYSLVINTNERGIVHCHFDADDEKMNRFYTNIGKKINVTGLMDSEKTMMLDNYSITTD